MDYCQIICCNPYINIDTAELFLTFVMRKTTVALEVLDSEESCGEQNTCQVQRQPASLQLRRIQEGKNVKPFQIILSSEALFSYSSRGVAKKIIP